MSRGEQEGQQDTGYNMGWYVYGNCNHQGGNGYLGSHQMGHQINQLMAGEQWNGWIGQEYPPLGQGGPYGTGQEAFYGGYGNATLTGTLPLGYRASLGYQ